jgi:Zn-dependent protease
MDEIIRTIAVYALPVLFAITVHEAAHAYAAKHFGDTTAFVAGRMSLNPVKHIDPVGTIALPLLLVIIGSNFMFGWAKPVPVVASRLRNPHRHMAWVALAGPGANFVMALMWYTLNLVCRMVGVEEPFIYHVAQAGAQVNLLLFAFNLMPVLPLDGGRIVEGLLPKRLALRFSMLEPYGMYIVIGLIILKVASYWVVPVAGFAGAVITLLTTPFR